MVEAWRQLSIVVSAQRLEGLQDEYSPDTYCSDITYIMESQDTKMQTLC